MSKRNPKHLFLAKEGNFFEGARNCFGEQPPNHAIEGSDFILVITSKNYPEDSNGVLTAARIRRDEESECTSSSRVKEK